MSLARSSQCVFCLFRRTPRASARFARDFHPSNTRRKGKSKTQESENAQSTAANPSGSSAQDGYVDIHDVPNFKQIDKETWQKHYTAEQVEAIETASKAIQPGQLDKRRAPQRTDPWSLDYFDDLTSIHPVVDKQVRAPWTNLDDNLRLKTEDELLKDLSRMTLENDFSKQGQDGEDDDIFQQLDENIRLTIGKEEAELDPPTALAPEIPPMSKPKANTEVKKAAGGTGADREPSPALVRLMQMTGYTRKQISQLKVKSVLTRRVVNQTRLGKIPKLYYLSVAGNENGMIGIGEGKSEEGAEAMLQSQYRAIRNMQPILRYEDRTIFGDVKGKVAATELELYARPPGFGLRCQEYIWHICKCAGIHDLAARVTRARNPMNVVKATIQALISQKDPEDIARGRGKKLVDVRKVYYAGQI